MYTIKKLDSWSETSQFDSFEKASKLSETLYIYQTMTDKNKRQLNINMSH